MLNRKEFMRVTPESVGIDSRDIEWLLDQLESGFTEPHGLMIMRHGKFAQKDGGILMHRESVMDYNHILRHMRQLQLELLIQKES